MKNKRNYVIDEIIIFNSHNNTAISTNSRYKNQQAIRFSILEFWKLKPRKNENENKKRNGFWILLGKRFPNKIKRVKFSNTMNIRVKNWK